MQRMRSLALVSSMLVTSPLLSIPSFANPIGPAAPPPAADAQAAAAAAPDSGRVRYAQAARGHMGGGFIEMLFGDAEPPPRQGPIYTPFHGDRSGARYEVEQFPRGRYGTYVRGEPYARGEPGEYAAPERRAMNPRYNKQVVDYEGKERPGTIIIDTPNRFLFLVQDGGKAIRYGIGVGRPGFTWAGVKAVSQKREWPDWRPPDEMLRRRPDLPRYMPGGPDNPLGARALYLGSSLYRIHGSNEPWTIGTAVSSGCIRMRNEDVIDLYGRVNVGTKVVVI
jgi:lipoprotein-anchoring transpeptidase ErfK/SrfK